MAVGSNPIECKISEGDVQYSAELAAGSAIELLGQQPGELSICQCVDVSVKVVSVPGAGKVGSNMLVHRGTPQLLCCLLISLSSADRPELSTGW